MEDIKKIKARINWICRNKINAFSPTISPAPKSAEHNEIESIEEGVKYYLKRGVTEFVFQKKYMGSYCDIYLHKNLEETFFVSRNAHKITHIDLPTAIEACKPLHAKLDWQNTTCIIIQAELLPWDILGKGLIENEFNGYLDAHKTHHNFITQSTLYTKLDIVKNTTEFKNFVQDANTLSDKNLKEKYPSHIIRQYKAINEFKILELDSYKNGIDVYEKQIAHFGKSEPLHFKPFNILKKIMADGSEEIMNDNLSYALVNDDVFMQLKIDNTIPVRPQLDAVYAWLNQLTNALEEGIVIKPMQAFIVGLPPAFKVRNNNYLTMIYGVNFINDLAYNIGKRAVGKKIDCSKNDWMLNWELLKTKNSSITLENYAYKNLLLDRILGEQIANTLDHRL